MTFRSYATYIRGLDRDGPIPGLLSLDDTSLRFESFEKKSPLAALLPEHWRPAYEPFVLEIPQAEIARITDLQGGAERGLLTRILLWLNVEPNGVQVRWGERTIVFDVERPIDALIR